jgi:hypothetical protein
MSEYDNKLYPKAYGRWTGRPAGIPPDHARCCVEVSSRGSGWASFAQCARKRGHGPDLAYCKQHVPATVEARKGAADAKATAVYNRRRKEIYGSTFWGVLKRIAEGHNDPRALAQGTLDDFHRGDAK